MTDSGHGNRPTGPAAPSGRAGHAIVIGGSIGGLLAARVLSETFARVSVIDRDNLPDESAPRRGVPQSHHTHGLLSKGCEILNDLFPGLTSDLVALGALTCDIQDDCRWYNDGRRLRQAPSQLQGLAVSRPRLELYLRSRVAALTGVEIHQRREVVGLIADEERRRVRGVRLLPAGAGPDDAEEVAAADLVVDATGRGNRGATWLRSLGYDPAPEERVDSGLVYVTREYRHRPGAEDVTAILVGHNVSVPRGGFAIRADGDRWLITLLGMGGDLPPVEPEGYEQFATRLPVPDIHQLIQRLEPLGPPRLMRIPTSIRRRYERLDRFPEGYVVFADALCQFNPSYGQGMTVAACEAIALRQSLQSGPGGSARLDALAHRFFPLAARVIDVPWDMAVGGDLRFPSVEGRRTPRVKLLNAYIARLHVAAETDPVVGNAFLSVANLAAPPQRLFAPGILARVLRPRSGRPTASGAPGTAAAAGIAGAPVTPDRNTHSVPS